MTSRTTEIKLTVDLDGENLPTRIEWQATEGQENGPASCQSMMLSLWDSENIHKMADTYLRATKNADVANSIHEFGDGFGETLGLISRSAN